MDFITFAILSGAYVVSIILAEGFYRFVSKRNWKGWDLG